MEASAARAPKPALISVGDDPAVARAVQRDLRRRYGERYRGRLDSHFRVDGRRVLSNSHAAGNTRFRVLLPLAGR